MQQINTIIVDDEAAAIKTLRGMLAGFCPQVNVVGDGTSVEQAVQLTETHRPDLVFLDIEMPPMGSGFDFLRLAKPINFEVIFTTAYPQHAIKAINLTQPLAYLIKPYSVTDLVDAVDVATKKILDRPQKLPTGTEEQGFIIPGSKKGNLVLRYKEVVCCQADKMLTQLYLQRNGTFEKANGFISLGELENSLPDTFFLRIHNSYIINLSHVTSFDLSSRAGVVYLTNGMEVPVSGNNVKIFKERFDLFFLGK